MKRIILTLAASLAACSAIEDATTSDDPPTEWKCPLELTEDRSVYAQDPIDVDNIDLTVDDLDGLAAVQADSPDAVVPVVLRDGPLVAYGELELRGQSSRLAYQKSYKVKLVPDAELWNGQRELNLNKHPYDLTRVRQMLSFTLFRDVPGFTSLRTRFVHLSINGEDYGLYTQIEEPNKRFLAAHGLDPAGTLYKAQFFSFDPIDSAAAADPATLELLLEAQANPDSAKLLEMVRAVNDLTVDIDDVIATHFDRQNYVTWLALNLLLGNFDTRNQNFLLYSPSGCARWYFMPWDYDGALGWPEQPRNPPRPRWMAGLATYWAVPLHERFMEKPANVDEVRARMTELRQTALSDERIDALLASYQDLVRSYTTSAPDVWQLPVRRGTVEIADSIAQWDAEYARIHGAVRGLDVEFDAVRGRPMPVILFSALSVGDMLFQWTPSFSLRGDDLTYDFALSTSPGFEPETMVEEQRGLRLPMSASPRPPAGTYYWRVISRASSNPEENWQMSFNAAQMILLP